MLPNLFQFIRLFVLQVDRSLERVKKLCSVCASNFPSNYVIQLNFEPVFFLCACVNTLFHSPYCAAVDPKKEILDRTYVRKTIMLSTLIGSIPVATHVGSKADDLPLRNCPAFHIAFQTF